MGCLLPVPPVSCSRAVDFRAQYRERTYQYSRPDEFFEVH
jgi:hypothetical protein